MTTIILVRHGENDFVGKRLAGRTPGVHLNPLGQQQAEELAGVLSSLPVKSIYSSPLERALETAAPLAAALKLPVTSRPALIEVDYGHWQGKTFKQLHRLKDWKNIYQNAAEFQFPGGESLLNVQQRVCQELESLKDQHPGEDVIICFSHGDIIRLAVSYYLNMPFDNFHRLAINPASITTLTWGKDNQPRLVHYNQIVHLDHHHL